MKSFDQLVKEAEEGVQLNEDVAELKKNAGKFAKMIADDVANMIRDYYYDEYGYKTGSTAEDQILRKAVFKEVSKIK
jgi:hypothetical protein